MPGYPGNCFSFNDSESQMRIRMLRERDDDLVSYIFYVLVSGNDIDLKN